MEPHGTSLTLVEPATRRAYRRSATLRTPIVGQGSPDRVRTHSFIVLPPPGMLERVQKSGVKAIMFAVEATESYTVLVAVAREMGM